MRLVIYIGVILLMVSCELINSNREAVVSDIGLLDSDVSRKKSLDICACQLGRVDIDDFFIDYDCINEATGEFLVSWG